MIESVDDIISRFGGPTLFGEALGINRTHAGAMKTRKSIPPEYWERLVSTAAAKGVEGVTLEALARMAARKSQSENETGAAA